MCIFVSFNDIKTNHISNRLLLRFGIAAVCINCINSYLAHNRNIFSYFVTVLSCCAVALILYFTNVWAGGDCKFFMVICLSIPYEIYEMRVYKVSIVFLIPVISFFISYIYVVVESLYCKFKKGQKTHNMTQRTIYSFFKYASYYFTIVLISYLTNGLYSILGLPQKYSFYLSVVNIIIVLVIIFSKILNNKIVLSCVLVVSNIMIFVSGPNMVYNRINFLLWGTVLIVFFVRSFANTYNYKSITVDELSSGMILSTAYSILMVSDRYNGFDKVSDESLKSRLKREDVEKIKTTISRKKELSEIVIVKKVPFALFISISTVFVVLGRELCF